MKVKEFNKDLHLDLINQWRKARKLAILRPEDLPSQGLYIENKGAIFLYKTDGPFCMLEELVVNPEVSPEVREAVIHRLLNHGCELAKELGYNAVMGFTKFEVVVKHCLKAGFKLSKSTFRLVSKEL